MSRAPIPNDETQRLQALKNYRVLDTDKERVFENITQYIAKQFHADMAFISFIDSDRQWFKSICGADIEELSRDDVICAHTILSREVNYIVDATKDPRTKDLPAVKGDPPVRFYCGAPLIAPEGHVVGSLCVVSSEARDDFSIADQHLLKTMAEMVVMQLDLRTDLADRAEIMKMRVQATARADRVKHMLGAFVENVPVAIALIDLKGEYFVRSNRWLELQKDFFPPEDQDNFLRATRHRSDWAEDYKRVLAGETVVYDQDVLERLNGHTEYAKWELNPWYVEDNELAGIILSVTLVTGQVSRRIKAEAQNELFEAVLESIDNGVVACDAQGSLTLFNQASVAMHGIGVTDTDTKDVAQVYDLYEEDGVTPLKPDRIPLFRALKGEAIDAQTIVIAPANLPRRTVMARARQLRRPDGHIIGAVTSMLDVTAAKRARQKLLDSESLAKHIAFHDTLTGLYNRAKYNDLYGQENTVGADQPTAAFFIDLNRFKLINDTLGHKFGDDLLIRVAKMINSAIGTDGFVARFGGDEFIAVRPVDDAAQAMRIAQSISDELNIPIALAGHTIVTGAAIGVAISPDHGTDVDTLVRRADIAMYRAKVDDLSEPILFEPVFELKRVERSRLEGELMHAIRNEELRVYYQAIVCSQTTQIKGVEALVRWQHPRLGLIGPNRFISIAEETGFIVELGQWVLETAVSQFKDLSGIFVSVNVSPIQFQDSSLVGRILKVLTQTGFDPHRLELEITETLLIDDAVMAREVVDRLQSKGIRIALDDFGTGYSSLTYIRQMPFNKVKIDRSFVADLGQSDESAAVVGSIMELADSLDMVVTAEGVETEAQEKLLRDAGAHTLQGYRYSRPVSFKKFAKKFLSTPDPIHASQSSAGIKDWMD